MGVTTSGITFGNVGSAPSGTAPNNGADPTPRPGETQNSGDYSYDGSALSCSANVGGGAYNAPVSVTVSCNGAAQIRYCLAENSCCDPETAGTIYAGPIAIGADAKTYCLSFYGDNGDSTSSKVERSYTFSSAVPDLQVVQEKTFYQTTQLDGVTSLASDDFGKSGHDIGIINLKTHDPGPGGLNLTCMDVVEDFATLPAPSPSVLLSATDMQPLSASAQLDVMLGASELVYGSNHLTSYVVASAYAPTQYACSTNLVTLEDFEFFQAEPAHGETGTTTVREFSGGFSAYGFFEEEDNIYRGPAGLSAETQTGQELRTGMFGVFY